jgi:hypothetical protein
MNTKCRIDSYVVADEVNFKGEKYVSEGVIRFDGRTIEVAFDEYLFLGEEFGTGHWVCKDKHAAFDGSMILHQIPGSKIVEGYYEGSQEGESRFKGFIRIFFD